MTNNFDLISNLPLLLFGFCFFIDFILFLWAAIVLLTAKRELQRIEKGRKFLSTAFVGFLIILLMVLVFYLVSYSLKKGEAFLPPAGVPGEFPPPSHIDNFPPAPQFIKIGNYYFTGPWLLKKNKVIREPAGYAILCKKNEEYDIIYIGEQEGRIQLLGHEQYKCWMENCNQNIRNLYLVIFWTPLKRYNSAEREKIKEELEGQINPPCPVVEI